ncbi:MAG: 2-C-methyl-D-erythritol 4-phosphate cytidylyltransferase [Thermoanaerobaculia bacterium]
MHWTVIIPAGGSGARFGSDVPKQYLPLRGRPLLAHTVGRFTGREEFSSIVIAASPSWHDFIRELTAGEGWTNVGVVNGGATRQESVLNGLRHAKSAGSEWVAVHDAVRPFFSDVTLRRLLAAATECGAALPALPATETIHLERDGIIVETPDRSSLMAAQTPQCFRLSLLLESIERALRDGISGTDEAAVVARYGGTVRIIPGDRTNLKITHADDLEAAERNYDRWMEAR